MPPPDTVIISTFSMRSIFTGFESVSNPSGSFSYLIEGYASRFNRRLRCCCFSVVHRPTLLLLKNRLFCRKMMKRHWRRWHNRWHTSRFPSNEMYTGKSAYVIYRNNQGIGSGAFLRPSAEFHVPCHRLRIRIHRLASLKFLLFSE